MIGLSRNARFTRLVAAVMAAICILAIPACARGASDVDWPEDPTPAPIEQDATPTDGHDAAVAEEIIALVEDYRIAEVASFADPKPPHIARPVLSNFLADPLLSEVLTLLNDMQQGGIAFHGEPTWMPIVTELRVDETPATAVVRDCVDATGWQSVFMETGEPVPGDIRPDRYVNWLNVKRFPDGWLVYDSDVEEGAEC